MRILHIFDHSIPLHSGYTFRSRAILQHQRAMGWETEQITGPKHNLAASTNDDEETIDGLKFYRTRPMEGLTAKLPVINQWQIVTALRQRLVEIIPRLKPTLIHAHSPALNGLAALSAGKKFSIPVVYEIRAFWEDAAVDHGTSKEWGIRYRLTRALESYVVKNVDAVTTICEGLRTDILARGVAPQKVTVIPNAVDIANFKYGAEPDPVLLSQLGLQDKIVLGFIGSFYAYEGLPLLVQALPRVLQKYPQARILLVGGGPQEAYLKDMVEGLNLGDKVIFTGRVPHSQVQQYYDLVNIFVYPRLSMRLTELVTPLKPLEAMAQGRLVLASDIGGHRELISDWGNGVLFKAGDIDALSATIVHLLQDTDRWLSIKQEGRKFVETQRNWQTSVDRYKSVYDFALRNS